MHHIDFLNDDLVDLPKTWTGDYVAFMDDLFCKYIRHVQAVDRRTPLGVVISTKLGAIQVACDALMRSLRAVLSGDRTTAYKELDVALTGLGPHFDALCPKGDMSTLVNPIYRFRSLGDKPFLRKDLFHIPFHLPHLIKEMRYSVAGLPCLYLGGSTHVCWRELGEPALNTIAVARYSAVPNSNLRVLNFGHRMPVLAAYTETEPNRFLAPNTEVAFIAAQVACWPLVAICSIRVPDRSRPERPEYAIPQLVLEWITRTRAFHGIRYFSTHYDEYIDNPKTYMNYVFPASAIAPRDYCTNLIGLFELTEPKTWDDAKAIPVSLAGISRPIYKTREKIDVDLENEFGRIEDGLLNLPLDIIIP
jgi:hypothetical protein